MIVVGSELSCSSDPSEVTTTSIDTCDAMMRIDSLYYMNNLLLHCECQKCIVSLINFLMKCCRRSFSKVYALTTLMI